MAELRDQPQDDPSRNQHRDATRTHRDRPGQPRQSDIDKVDRAIADRHARHPQYSADRQAIWRMMREASGSPQERPGSLDHPQRRESRQPGSDQPAQRQPADHDGDLHIARDDHSDAASHREPDLRGPSSGDARHDDGPEITGMRLPEGFDAGEVHWLRRYRDKNADRIPEPDDLKPRPLDSDEAAAARSTDDAIWPPPDDRSPDTPHDREEVAERNLEKLTEMDPEKLSRLARARGELWRSSEDIADSVREYTDLSYEVLDRPPPGKAEVRTPQPVWVAPHDGIEAGTAAEGLFFLGFTIAEGVVRVRTKLQERKEEHHGG